MSACSFTLKCFEEIKDMASSLLASDIFIQPINEKNRAIKRIRYVDKIRTDFVIRENSVALPGDKTIYLRLMRPDAVTLGSEDLQVIAFNGDDIPVSASRTVTYENADLPVSIFWTNNGEIVPGEYGVELYCEGKQIGVSTFILK